MKSRAKELRLRAGYQKQVVAAMAGIGVRTLERVERGELGVQLETVVRVAGVFGVAVSDLLPPLGARPKKPRAFSPRWAGAKSRTPLRGADILDLREDEGADGG